MQSSRTDSNGTEINQAAAVNVKLLVVCGSDRTCQAANAKTDSHAARSVARKGSSQADVVITSPRASAKPSPAPSSSSCIHCQVYPWCLHTVQPAGKSVLLASALPPRLMHAILILVFAGEPGRVRMWQAFAQLPRLWPGDAL